MQTRHSARVERPRQRTGYSRFAALGDSLTVGVGDPGPDGRPCGFADRLAEAVNGAVYVNVARTNVKTEEILAVQVPEAASLRPDLVCVVAGINDIIAMRYPITRVDGHHRALFAALRHQCPDARILTCTLPDLGHASVIARALRGRVLAHNRIVRSLAVGYGVDVVDLWNLPPLSLHQLSVDRIHPSTSGHVLFAAAFAKVLGVTLSTTPDAAQEPPGTRGMKLHRVYRTAVAAPRFITKRMARDRLIVSQPAKHGFVVPPR